MMCAMDDTKCQETVLYSYRRFQCQTKPTVTRDGKLYCKKHDPAPVYDTRETWYAWDWNGLHTVTVVAQTDSFIHILNEGATVARRWAIKGYFKTREEAIAERRRAFEQGVKGYEEAAASARRTLDKFNQEYPVGGADGKT